MKKILAKVKEHWLLFLVSLVADVFGIWWFFSAQQANIRIDAIETNISHITGTDNISVQWKGNSTIQWDILGSQVYQNSSVQQTIVPKTSEEKKADEITQRAKGALNDFYNAINNKDFVRVEALSHNTFIADPSLSKYFWKTYLANFLAIIDGTWRIQNIKEDADKRKDERFTSRRGFNYEMYYVLKNGQPYKDKWNAIVVYNASEDRFFINALNCETKKCVNQPFFTLR